MTDRDETAAPAADVLERNVDTLLGTSYDPPRMADAARARIRGQLVARHAPPARAGRRPLIAVGLGLAAAATAAIVAGAVLRRGGPRGAAATTDGRDVALADGTHVLLDVGARVDVLGPRRVRVTGQALLDVAHGKERFVVETAHGTLAVLGTRFVVDASVARTFAAVIRGSVRLATEHGDVVLGAGEQGVAEPGRPPTRGPAPRLSHLASWAAQARKTTDGDPPVAVRNGTLFARDPGFRSHPPYPDNEFPLPLAQLTVDAVVDHQVARVAIDQTFENPQDQDLEGVYRFAIPPDAALQRFAMYVDGKLTESAVVERMRARRIYEELVYHRVDPGLLEWAGAGRLAMRVYPLRARSDKRVVLAYTQSLPRLYDDWTLTVPLPEVDSAVDDVAFRVRVTGCGGCELHSPSHAVQVATEGDDAIVTYHGAAETIGDSLVLVARDRRTAPQLATHTDADGEVVVVRARPDLGAPAERHRARSWVIIDDVSASRGALERRAQADVVEALLRDLDEDDRVAVLTVDSIVRDRGGLERVDDVDHRAVRELLTAPEVGGVGATDLGQALDRATALLAGVDPRDAYVIYLGDGVVTGGDRGLAALSARLVGKAMFVGVGIGDGADAPTLAALADASGGMVYTMDLADDLAWRTFDLVASLYTSRVTGLTAQLVDPSGQPIAGQDAYLRAGQLGDGEELELVARVPAGSRIGGVSLAGRHGGAAWSRRIDLTGAVASDGGYLPRLWAQRRVAALLLQKEDAVVAPPCGAPPCASVDELRRQHREDLRLQIVALGKKYFLLSRHTSLLVLENDAMYAQYGVTKGTGDTWAPYAVPATVAVRTVAAAAGTAAGVDPGAALVRTPVERFYDYSAVYRQAQGARERAWAGPALGRMGTIGHGAGGGGMADGDETGGLWSDAHRGAAVAASVAPLEKRKDLNMEAAAGEDGVPMDSVAFAPQTQTRSSAEVTTGAIADRRSQWLVEAKADKNGTGVGYGSSRGDGRGDRFDGFGLGQQPYPIAYTDPSDDRLDDLTEWIPALFPGPVDAEEADLVRAGGGAAGSIDAAARALVDRARRALPVGTYTIGDGPAIAVTAGGALAWRTVDGNGLEELARLDGAVWRRAYPELGLQVVRDLGTRTPALLSTYLPLLLPDPDHLAAWFTVTTDGAHTLVVAPAGDAAHPLLRIELDARDRVVAIRTAGGAERLAVTWGAQGPIAYVESGRARTVGFSPVNDPLAAPTDLVDVTLPLAQPRAAQARVAALAVGSAEWRGAERQVLATAAATGDGEGAWTAFDALAAHGAVGLGDVVLAGRGIAARPAADYARAVAGFGADPAARPAPVRYLDAARAFRQSGKAAALAPAIDAGVVGALWHYRHAIALVATGKRDAAVTAIAALGDRVPDLQVVAAAVVGQRWEWPAAVKARAWDAVARGPVRNLARYEAARQLYQGGDYAAAADRVVALLADVDLTARPLQLDYLAQTAVQYSPRGLAGFEMAWRGYVGRIVTDGSYDDLVALAQSAAQLGRTPDLDRVIGRAVDVAAGDRGRLIGLLELAVATGQTERAAALMPVVAAGPPDATVERLAAELAVAQGQPDAAADHLERAIAAEAGPTPLSGARTDYAQLVALRGRAAQLAVGPARDAAIGKVLTVVRAWRELDPANPQIDSQAGELLLELDRPDEAWRQLATAIERDPMDGAGWSLVADALERHGRYDQALDAWQEALVLDQTNPGPRLRKAQLYYALGKDADGDAIVKDAARRTWHDRFWSDAEQLRQLARQRKLLGK